MIKEPRGSKSDASSGPVTSEDSLKASIDSLQNTINQLEHRLALQSRKLSDLEKTDHRQVIQPTEHGAVVTTRRNVLKNVGLAATGLAAGVAGLASMKPETAYAAPSGLQVFDVKTYGASGNGSSNDSSAIQHAIDDASNAGGGIVWFPAGVYRLGTGLTVSNQVILQGTGWQPTSGNGSWLYVDNTSVSAITISNNGRGSVVRDIAIEHLQDPPSSGWQPKAYPWAIRVQADDIHLENIFLLNPTNGINIFDPEGTVGRVTLERIWGHPLRRGIEIDNARDVIKINNVHFWFFWTQNSNVIAYQRANADAIVSFRNDNPHFSNIFAFQYRVGFNFGSSANGQTRKFRISNADLDLCSIAIDVTGDGTTGQFVNITGQGSAGSSGITGGFGIKVSAPNVRLQGSNIRLGTYTGNGVRVSQSNSVVFLENIWIGDWNRSGGGFPAIEAVSPARVYVGIGRFFENSNGAAAIAGSGVINKDDEVTP